MAVVLKSNKLNNVCYDIRGPVLQEAARLEAQGHKIIKLNIGNPIYFNFDTPKALINEVVQKIQVAQGYCSAKGLVAARETIIADYAAQGITNLALEDVCIGNGVSELILITMQALLNPDDEVLLPAPDYPLWTTAVNLSGGKPIHYLCDEQSDWMPDLADLKRKITSRSKAIVIINPNNPTGAVYPPEVLKELVEIAAKNELIIYSDEIYSEITFDGAKHQPIAAIDDELFVITFNGLSKCYLAAGFRVGWMILSGKKDRVKDYIDGINMLLSMRLCSNVPCQHAVGVALQSKQVMADLVKQDGIINQSRLAACRLLNEIPQIFCHKPKGALYLFPKVTIDPYYKHDREFAIDLLRSKGILIVPGTAFNWPYPDHFRMIYLPEPNQLKYIADSLREFLDEMRQSA